jgi:hypothetical protein
MGRIGIHMEKPQRKRLEDNIKMGLRDIRVAVQAGLLLLNVGTSRGLL